MENTLASILDNTWLAIAASVAGIMGYLTVNAMMLIWLERKLWFSHAFRKDVEMLLAKPPDESELYSPEANIERIRDMLDV